MNFLFQNRRSRSWLWFVLPFLLPGPSAAQDIGRLDQVVQSYVSKKQFMGTVLVGRDKILFSKGYGFANLEWNIPNSLGYLIEKISGEPYAKFLQGNIFTPLGMKDSGYDSNTAIIPHRASGYTPDANSPENAGFINMTIPFSARSLYSTTEDLWRWEQGLFGRKVLNSASLSKMTTPFKDNYAFGLEVSDA